MQYMSSTLERLSEKLRPGLKNAMEVIERSLYRKLEGFLKIAEQSLRHDGASVCQGRWIPARLMALFH